MRFIFFSGPSGAGKDTAGKILKEKLSVNKNIGILSLAAPLKIATHVTHGLYNLPLDYFENCKNEPHFYFKGISPRQAYINHAEFYVKPFYGKHFYADMLVSNVSNNMTIECGHLIESASYFDHYIITDLGKTTNLNTCLIKTNLM